MNPCSVCSKETSSYPVDINLPIYCSDCNPRYKCVDCGKPRMRPIGHSEYCEECFTKHTEESKIARSGGLQIIDRTKIPGLGVTQSHFKDLNTRVINDDGHTLTGKAGLEYMKSKGNTYASRLKDYYR
jgi:hypothetical protein